MKVFPKLFALDDLVGFLFGGFAGSLADGAAFLSRGVLAIIVAGIFENGNLAATTTRGTFDGIHGLSSHSALQE